MILFYTQLQQYNHTIMYSLNPIHGVLWQHPQSFKVRYIYMYNYTIKSRMLVTILLLQDHHHHPRPAGDYFLLNWPHVVIITHSVSHWT